MNMMNMTTSSGTAVSLPVMEMMPFHTVIGLDMLWFSSWMPSSAPSTFGACCGLFFLAVFHRFVLACLGMKAIRNTTYESWAAKKLNKVSKQPWTMQYPAFSLKMDLSMGLLEGLSSFIGYALMLAVMVMNVWFFIAIILGIIVGETSFGRFKRCFPPPEAYAEASECC